MARANLGGMLTPTRTLKHRPKVKKFKTYKTTKFLEVLSIQSIFSLILMPFQSDLGMKQSSIGNYEVYLP